jgi:hypothetical protein
VYQTQGRISLKDRGKTMEKISVGAGSLKGIPKEKERLIQLVRKILKSDTDLDFLRKLEAREVETLVACIRLRLELEKGFIMV